MMNKTGGLLTNGRTKSAQSDLPQASPMKPQAPQAAAPPPQPAQPQQPVQAPAQAPQGQPVPQEQPQGAPQGPGQEAPEGMNTMANNALTLLHDEQAAPQFEQMIAQGEEGAAAAAVNIGQQVIEADRAHGVEPNMEQASDAIMEVVGDIVEMGIAQGSMPAEPLINEVPAAVYATLAYASDQWAAAYPEFGQDLAAQVQQATQADSEAARQVAAYMKSRKSESGNNANQDQPQTQQRSPNDDPAGGRIAGSPQPM